MNGGSKRAGLWVGGRRLLSGFTLSVLLTACGRDENSLVERANLQRSRGAARAFVASPAEPPGFLEQFRFLRAFSVPAERTERTGSLTCAAGPRGEVYVGGRHLDRLYRFVPGQQLQTVSSITRLLEGKEALSLALSSRGDTLALLGENRLALLDPNGHLLRLIPFNSGQSGSAVVLLGDGRFVVGGEKWIRSDSAELVAVYDGSGRMETSFLPMDPTIASNQLVIYNPVLLAAAPGGGVYTSDSPRPDVLRLSLTGDTVQRIRQVPAQYREAPSLPPRLDSGISPEAVTAWLMSWTPIFALFSSDSLLYRAFRWDDRPDPYFLQVIRITDEVTVASAGMQGRPVCAVGDTIYSVSRAVEDSVRVSAYVLVEPQVTR
jgi:hypothetical protein